MSVDSVKAQIDLLANESYEDGWNDCMKELAGQPFSAARTQQLEENYNILSKVNRIQKRKLSLAVKLLRMAQASECGKLGQYDRFFEERYHEGIEDYV